MRKLTVAEMREKEVRNASEKYGIEYKELKTMMSRYYRLCGAYERLLYLENDERTCNNRCTQQLSEQTENRYFKLNNDFKKYGLEMKFFGYVPTICEIETTTTAIERHFYN